jgi:hypothetical protein
MKKIILFLFFIILSSSVDALGIGVVPDRLTFSDGDEKMTIINPNNSSIEFKITNPDFSCAPEEGEIAAKDRAEVMCRALPGAQDGAIVVETKGTDESLGLIPAVAIRADIREENEDTGQAPASEAMTAEKYQETHKEVADGPLMINEEPVAVDKETPEQRQEGIFQEMKAEMITIILLTAAILFVLAYRGIKDAREMENKNKEKPNTEQEPDTQATTLIRPTLTSAWNKDPPPKTDPSTPQAHGHPLSSSPSGTSKHSLKSKSGSSVSPQNSPRRQ